MIIYDSNKQASVAQIGLKASYLAHLKSRGINVPDWFALTTQCFDDFIIDHREEYCNLIDHYSENNRQKFVKTIANIEFSNSTKRKITAAIAKHFQPKEVLAIRTSLTEENIPTVNFIFVRQGEELFNRIKDCYIAYFSKDAIAKRREQGIAGRQSGIAIIIQKMIDADFSGTICTTNPHTNNPHEMLITARLGINKNIVGNIIVDNTNKTLTDTTKLAVRLNDEFIERLTKLGRSIENSFRPQLAQNVTFAIKNNRIYVLQTEPIQEYRHIDKSLPRTDFENTKLVDYYPDAVTPLTYSFMRSFYQDTYLKTLHYYKIPAEDIESAKRNLRNLFYLYENRIYYRPEIQRKNLALFTNNRKTRSFLLRQMQLSRSRTRRFIAKFDRITKPYRYANFQDYTNEQLLDIYSELEDEILADFTILAANDINAKLAYDTLIKKSQDLKIPRPQNVLSNIIVGPDNVESIQAYRDFISLVKDIKRDQNLTEIFTRTSTIELTKTLRVSPLIIFSKINNFITKYQVFTTASLAFETTTILDSPAIIINLIKKYLACDQLPSHSPSHIPAKNYYHNLHGLTKTDIKTFLKITTYFVNNREILYHRLLIIISILRAIYKKIGRNLAAQRVIERAGDIYFLEQNEINSIVNHNKYTNEEIRNKITKRKQSYLANQYRPNFEHICFYGAIQSENMLPILPPNHHKLVGTGCNQNLIIGTVQNVNRPQEIVPNHIIITKNINPSWNLTLPLASAAAIENGDQLSHNILALRNLGIASVYGIQNLTQEIADNTIVKIDSRNGTIESMQQPNQE